FRDKGVGMRGREGRVAIGVANLDHDIAALGPAELAHARAKVIDRLFHLLRREWGEHADMRHSRRPLRHHTAARHPRGEEHREQHQNPPHSMTSSAQTNHRIAPSTASSVVTGNIPLGGSTRDERVLDVIHPAWNFCFGSILPRSGLRAPGTKLLMRQATSGYGSTEKCRHDLLMSATRARAEKYCST